VTGLLYAHLFGLKQDELIQSKLGASDQARRSFGDLGNDIRAAKSWQIGYGTTNSFTANTVGTNQVGTAIKLCLSTNTGNYILYYYGGDSLYRYKSSSGDFSVLAQYINNSPYFEIEDNQGKVLSNNIPQKSILMTHMEFYQFQYPLTKVGTNAGYLYDRYVTEFRFTCHVPDGS